MKIIHIVRQFYPCIGGVENYIYNLSKTQLAAGNDVTVLTLNKNLCTKEDLSDNEIIEGIKIKRIPFTGSKRYPIALSSVTNLDGCDIVNIHCVDSFIDYLGILKPFHKKRIILSTHGGYFHTKWLKILKQVYFYTVTRIILYSCDKIIANSNSDHILFKKISNNVVRVDNGVEVEAFSSVSKNIEFGYLLYIGRLDSHKRIDNLVRTIPFLLKKNINVKLGIIGPDWNDTRKGLEHIAKGLGIKNSINFMGSLSRDNLLNELSKAHLFVSASEYEGFGISAIEAMASGTPCVLNDIASFRDFIATSKAGALVNFNDHEQAARAISNIICMDKINYDLMALNAKKKAKEYSWETVGKAVMKVYEDVLYQK